MSNNSGHNDLMYTHLMLEAGIVPVLPNSLDRYTSLRASFLSMSRAQRRVAKRKYRKLVRKSGAHLFFGQRRAVMVNHYLAEK